MKKDEKKIYCVEFFNVGYRGNSNGVTKVEGYEETFETENRKDALDEYKERKKYVRKEKNKSIGVSYTVWQEEKEIYELGMAFLLEC